MPEKLEGIPLVTDAARAYLNERQVADYRTHRRDLIRWTLHVGKDPETATGYATQTTYQRAYRLDAFYRWVWDSDAGYTLDVNHDHADAYMKDLAYSDYSQDHKANLMKALKMLFRWRATEQGGTEWDPEITFHDDTSTTNPRDFFTRENGLRCVRVS